MIKSTKRKLVVMVVGAFLFMLAFPMIVNASVAAITSFNMDRTTIAAGETITFSLTTTPQVNFVFADINGVRVQGTRQSGNNWQLVVSPTQSQNITVVAAPTNSVVNAALFNMPITVTNAPQQNQPNIPANVGPLDIVSITETPAIVANAVQLTVVSGIEANEVWVEFDRPGNRPGRFVRGQEQLSLRTATTRTWVINFTPQTWAVQTVRVSANRTYTTTGATNQNYTLTLSAPFVRPAIQNVNVSNRNLAVGAQTTLTIQTNTDVNFVWVMDMDGVRRNAVRTGQTATAATWTLTFAPPRTGQVVVFANATDTTINAVQRTENFTVGGGNASIINATASWIAGTNNSVRVEVTTDQFAGRVWVELPNGHRPMLNLQSGTGAQNRVWVADIHDVGNLSVLQVRASSNPNQFNTDASFTVNITGTQGGTNQQGTISLINGHNWMQSAWISHSGNGSTVTITFNTFANANLSSVWVSTPWGTQTAHRINNTQWTIQVPNAWFTTGQSLNFTFNGWLTTGQEVPGVSGLWWAN